jgi:hypothetical protein
MLYVDKSRQATSTSPLVVDTSCDEEERGRRKGNAESLLGRIWCPSPRLMINFTCNANSIHFYFCPSTSVWISSLARSLYYYKYVTSFRSTLGSIHRRFHPRGHFKCTAEEGLPSTTFFCIFGLSSMANCSGFCLHDLHGVPPY